jgi:hypothetical protein
MCHLLDIIATYWSIGGGSCDSKFVKEIHQQPRLFCMDFFQMPGFSFKTVWTSSDNGATTTRGSPSSSKIMPMQ